VQGGSTSYRAMVAQHGETQAARLLHDALLGPHHAPGMVSRSRPVARGIDYVTGELSNYGTRLGTDDRARVRPTSIDKATRKEPHATASTASCSPRSERRPTSDSMKAFNDLVAMALRCDVTARSA